MTIVAVSPGMLSFTLADAGFWTFNSRVQQPVGQTVLASVKSNGMQLQVAVVGAAMTSPKIFTS